MHAARSLPSLVLLAIAGPLLACTSETDAVAGHDTPSIEFTPPGARAAEPTTAPSDGLVTVATAPTAPGADAPTPGVPAEATEVPTGTGPTSEPAAPTPPATADAAPQLAPDEISTDLDPFDEVVVRGPVVVRIAVGAEPSIGGDPGTPNAERVTWELRGDELFVTVDDGIDPAAPPVVDVTAPDLEELTVEGPAAVELVDVALDDLELHVRDTATVSGTGIVGELDLDVVDEGRAALGDLVAEEVEVDVNDDAVAEVTATDSLDAEATGRSTITYGGDPADVDTDASDDATITSR